MSVEASVCKQESRRSVSASVICISVSICEDVTYHRLQTSVRTDMLILSFSVR